MTYRTLLTAVSHRVAVCRSRATFATNRERERVISLSTTALVLLAAFGTFAMSGQLATS